MCFHSSSNLVTHNSLLTILNKKFGSWIMSRNSVLLYGLIWVIPKANLFLQVNYYT